MQLEKLCGDLLHAKRVEDEATAKRIEVERAIIAIVGLPAEGAQTTDATGYKVRVDQKISRKVDEKKWVLIKDQIPAELHPVEVVQDLKVVNKGVLWLKENEPGYYKLFCQVMEEKPSKPSVKVEVV